MSDILDGLKRADELVDSDTNDIIQLCEECLLDPEKDYGQPKYVFSQNGIGFGPLGDIQMIKAPQKNGKTFLMTLMMGALMRGEYLGLKCNIENPRILYIDTEQHPRNTQLVFRRCCVIAKIPGTEKNEMLSAYHFRGKEPEMIKKSMIYLIETYKPHIVFLDGVRDIIYDFNDLKESSDVVRLLMDNALKYDCSIWSVIHVNPGSDKARGHSGTELQNKISDGLLCLKEILPSGEVIFTVNHSDARNKDINTFSFEIQDVPYGEGFIAIPVSTHISVKTKAACDETMARALNDCPLRYTDLVDKIMDVAAVKETSAKKMIKDASEAGIISKDPVYKKFHYVGLDLENENELPF